MDLNLFQNLKKDIESNEFIKNFIDELTNFLNNFTSSKNQINNNNIKTDLNIELNDNRKEGHLYLVTEDRNNEIYLWDFTDKPKHEFKEVISSEELLKVAKEGSMLQYKNGAYELYSENGYDMLFNEENDKNI